MLPPPLVGAVEDVLGAKNTPESSSVALLRSFERKALRRAKISAYNSSYPSTVLGQLAGHGVTRLPQDVSTSTLGPA